MTPASLRALVAAMTPGPWETDDPNRNYVCNRDKRNRYQYIADCSPDAGPGWSMAQENANAAGIVALRNAAPALVELWECAERFRVAYEQADSLSRTTNVGAEELGIASREANAAFTALLAAAKRVGEGL